VIDLVDLAFAFLLRKLTFESSERTDEEAGSLTSEEVWLWRFSVDF